MSLQPLERVDTLEHLDFHHDPACEHSQHGDLDNHAGPASVLVEAVQCPSCGDPALTLYLCEKFWRDASTHGVICSECLHGIDKPYRLIARVKA